jgi:hypothetical protein
MGPACSTQHGRLGCSISPEPMQRSVPRVPAVSKQKSGLVHTIPSSTHVCSGDDSTGLNDKEDDIPQADFAGYCRCISQELAILPLNISRLIASLKQKLRSIQKRLT